MSISLRSMRYLTTALRQQSISKAAQELSVAASAVSAAIDQIEDELQLKLVNRVRARGISATANGRVMERKFVHLLEEYEAVMAEGSDLRQAMTGVLRIGYYAPVAPAFLPAILAPLSELGSGITYHLAEDDNDRVQEGLLAGDYDAIMFVSEAALPQIEYDPLVQAPAYCLVAADHPLGRNASVRLKELASERIIVLNRPFAVDYYHRLFEEIGQSPATLAYANSTEMVRSLVGAGHGCAILNMLPATDMSYAGHRLVARPIRDSLPPLSLAIGYDKANPRRIVRHFVERSKTHFAEGDGRQHIVQE